MVGNSEAYWLILDIFLSPAPTTVSIGEVVNPGRKGRNTGMLCQTAGDRRYWLRGTFVDSMPKVSTTSSSEVGYLVAPGTLVSRCHPVRQYQQQACSKPIRYYGLVTTEPEQGRWEGVVEKRKNTNEIVIYSFVTFVITLKHH